MRSPFNSKWGIEGYSAVSEVVPSAAEELTDGAISAVTLTDGATSAATLEDRS